MCVERRYYNINGIYNLNWLALFLIANLDLAFDNLSPCSGPVNTSYENDSRTLLLNNWLIGADDNILLIYSCLGFQDRESEELE